MNRKLVFRLLGQLLLIEAALMLPSLAVALIYGEGDAPAFVYTILLCAAVGLPLTLKIHAGQQNLNARDGMAVAGLSWVVLSFFGALPFVFSGAIPGLADAYFEAVSGFTTTGSTILTQVEGLAHGVLFWRSFTHWVGGMGVLIFTLALMPRLTGRTSHLARAESPGPTFSKLLPRMSDTAKALYGLYIALSMIQTVCLLLAGMNLFDALIHTFGTAGTGGFSNYNLSVGAFQNPAIEWIIAVFMLLFGVNFAIYFRILRRDGRDALRGEEFLTYLGLALAATVAIALCIQAEYGDFLVSLRHAFFQVMSVMSTSGFATADFNLWPVFAKAVLVLLMCFGACAGSTAGGFKISRVVMLFKATVREIRHTLQPRKVSVVRLDGKTVPEETLSQLGIFLFIYILLALAGGVLLSLETGDATTAFTAALTCLSNVGPGLGAVGPAGNFAFFSPQAKLLCSFLMLAGRLEVYPLLVLFSIHLWKSN